MLGIHLHMFRSPPIIESITFRIWNRSTCHKYLELYLRTVPGSHTDLVLHPRMEVK